MKAKPSLLIGIWLFAVAATASAQSLRFYAIPFRAQEGDAVTFVYLEQTNSIPRQQITFWQWDFDGDGVVDASGTDPNQINAVWYATFSRDKAVNGVYRVKPTLSITTLSGQTYTETNGVTEDVVGLATGDASFDRDPFVEVVEFVGGNQDLKANFGSSTRLATNGTAVRFFSEVEFLKAGRIVSVDWDFSGTENFAGGNPQAVFGTSAPTNIYTSAQIPTNFTVSMRVQYQLRTNATAFGPTNQFIRTRSDFVRLVNSPGLLALGRAYRRGFPETYDYDDLVQTYSASGADGDRRVYFHLLEQEFANQQNNLRVNGFSIDPTTKENQRRQLAELANEILQGQLLIGQSQLIKALRIKYPRITDPDAAEDRLPAPPGVREETAAIDLALLDFHAALFHVSQVVQGFGMDVLRSKAPEGREPFPDFPRYLTFEDPTLAQKPIPVKNEWWQLTWCLDRMALGTVEKAKKLFNLSIQDPLARTESKEECKKAGLQGYLGMALLAAGQSTNDFALNEGNSLLAHVKNARDLFENINAGLNPLGNDGSFIPNESFAAILQDAQESVGDAKGAELDARNEKREFDQRQATLRNELLSQRSSYITPLKLLTGIDPANYNNLQTVSDQNDYRTTVRNRIGAILRDYPNTSASGAGEIGVAVLTVLDAGQNVQLQVNSLQNLFRRIDIRKWASTRVTDTLSTGADTVYAIDLVVSGLEGAVEASKATEGHKTSAFISASYKGYQLATKQYLEAMQKIKVSNIELEAEVRGALLEQNNLAVAIERANNQLDQSRLALENQEQRMDRLIEDLAHTRATAENLYFVDPSFRVVVSRAQRRAEAELDFAVDRLYRLAKTLQYEWTEPYQNPLVIPALSREPAALENPLFDQFTQLDSVFNVRTADEAKDYLDALKAWDSKLRRINIISVRGPNHAGPLSAEPFSLREQVFNFKPTTNYNDAGAVTFAMTLSDSVQRFRDFLETKRVDNPQNPANKSLELKFATTIEDNRFFPATGAEWNMRIGTIRVDLVAENGFSGTQVAEVDLTQSGIVTIRRFYAEPPAADDLFQLTFNTGNRIDRSAFTIKVPARVNGATGGRPPTEFDAPGLAGRPVAATEWILRIDTAKPSNRMIDFTKLKDIIIRFTYTYGNPAEFPNF